MGACVGESMRHIGQASEVVLVGGDQGARTTVNAPREFGENRPHAKALNAHAGGADHISRGASLVIDALDVLVHQSDSSTKVMSAGVAPKRPEAAGQRPAWWRLPANGRACSKPQCETSKRGLIKMMSAMEKR